ncbi:MAG TPA: Xaa-Pro peptidase family protein [Actinomycetota bacterium]|nr:Xaa-Pro peptidase family protein [Actinomycetota bacterium]
MSASRYEERRARALGAAEEAGLAGLLVTPGSDFYYLTGHEAEPYERLTVLILAADRGPVLLVPALERPLAEAAPGIDGVEIVDWRDEEDAHDVAARIVPAGRYAISDQTWASHVLELERATTDCLFVPAGRALPLLRAVKDDEEVKRLRAVAGAADDVFADLVEIPFGGRPELEISEVVRERLLERGHETADFAIVASGPNGASPHHGAGERTIETGDAVVLDFGGTREGYYSDITRTVFVGEPDEEQGTVYAAVRAAQQAAFDAIGPGVAAQDVDRAARAVISDAGYGDRFVHRTGHGIGLDLHEPPYIVEGNETLLQAGMTFSDEPGIYLPGRFGVRIEDQVLVTPSGAERLNEAARDVTVVA